MLADLRDAKLPILYDNNITELYTEKKLHDYSSSTITGESQKTVMIMLHTKTSSI